MRTLRYAALLILAACPALRAESTSTTAVSLNQIIEMTRKNNPAILSARKKWEAATEKIPQARSFPDPVATFVKMKDDLQTRAGPIEEKYSLSQKIPFWGKRGLKGSIAEQDAWIAEQAYKAKSLEIFSKVAHAYYELFYVDRSLEVNEELADQIRHFARVAERKYAVGRQEQASVFRAHVELAKILNDLITLRQERVSSLAKLNALLNRSPRAPHISEEPKDFTFEYKVEDLEKVGLSNRPEILAAKALIGRHQAARSLVIREFFPDLTLSYEVSKVGAGTTNTNFDGEDASAIGFKINLPLWYNRLVPGAREARANVEASQALHQDWNNRTLFEINDLAVKVETASRLVKLFNDTVLPQAEQALKSSQSGYEADRVNFLDLLDSIRMLLKFHLEFYRYEANYAQTRVTLERVLGVPLSQLPASEGGSHEK